MIQGSQILAAALQRSQEAERHVSTECQTAFSKRPVCDPSAESFCAQRNITLLPLNRIKRGVFVTHRERLALEQIEASEADHRRDLYEAMTAEYEDGFTFLARELREMHADVLESRQLTIEFETSAREALVEAEEAARIPISHSRCRCEYNYLYLEQVVKRGSIIEDDMKRERKMSARLEEQQRRWMTRQFHSIRKDIEKKEAANIRHVNVQAACFAKAAAQFHQVVYELETERDETYRYPSKLRRSRPHTALAGRTTGPRRGTPYKGIDDPCPEDVFGGDAGGGCARTPIAQRLATPSAAGDISNNSGFLSTTDEEGLEHFFQHMGQQQQYRPNSGFYPGGGSISSPPANATTPKVGLPAQSSGVMMPTPTNNDLITSVVDPLSPMQGTRKHTLKRTQHIQEVLSSRPALYTKKTYVGGGGGRAASNSSSGGRPFRRPSTAGSKRSTSVISTRGAHEGSEEADTHSPSLTSVIPMWLFRQSTMTDLVDLILNVMWAQHSGVLFDVPQALCPEVQRLGPLLSNADKLLSLQLALEEYESREVEEAGTESAAELSMSIVELSLTAASILCREEDPKHSILLVSEAIMRLEMFLNHFPMHCSGATFKYCCVALHNAAMALAMLPLDPEQQGGASVVQSGTKRPPSATSRSTFSGPNPASSDSRASPLDLVKLAAEIAANVFGEEHPFTRHLSQQCTVNVMQMHVLPQTVLPPRRSSQQLVPLVSRAGGVPSSRPSTAAASRPSTAAASRPPTAAASRPSTAAASRPPTAGSRTRPSSTTGQRKRV